jgi:flagellar hook-associated protein 2
MATVSSLSSNSQAGVYQLVQQYMSLEQTAYTRLQTQKSDLQQRQSVLTDLGTNLRSLRSAVADFRWAGATNPINTFTTSSSDSTVVTASATGRAMDATHVVTVQSLAKAHSIASDEFSGDEAAKLGGTHSFHIVQDGKSSAVTVTIGEAATYGDVLATVAAAINDSGAQVTATVASTNTNTGRQRLLLTSKLTGTQALIAEVRDDSGELARTLGFAGDSDVAGGFGGSTVQEAADARFTIDGLAFVSATNRVTGALTGLNMDLGAVSDGPVTVTVERDVDEIKTNVQGFIDAYNKLLSYVRDKTKGADENGENRGLLAGDSLYTTLRSGLRSIVTAAVPDATGQADLVRLSQIGITADSEGKLSISDATAFEDALADQPGEVERLFADEKNGLAVRLYTMLDQFTKAGGLLDQQANVIRSRQRALDDRMAREETRLARREEQLTTQLAGLQVMAQQLQQQQQIVDIMSSYTTST